MLDAEHFVIVQSDALMPTLTYSLPVILTDFLNCSGLTGVGDIPYGLVHFEQGVLYYGTRPALFK